MPPIRLSVASRLRLAVLSLLAGIALSPLSASATFITENAEPNGTRLTATPIPDAAFDFTTTGGLAFRNATNDPAAPAYRTAGLFGTHSTIIDVDFFSFAGQAGELIYIDVDNDDAILCPSPCNFDAALALFSSTGAILAVGESVDHRDFGSSLILDPFIGVFTLPTTDTYFIGVAPGILSLNLLGLTFSPLTRPDGFSGGDGGYAVQGSPADRDAFGAGQQDGGYLTWVSRSSAATNANVSVSEPGTLTLFGVGIAALGLIRRRRLRRIQ
jgi:hypothetical protein